MASLSAFSRPLSSHMVFAAGDDFYRIVFTVFLLFTTTFLPKVDKVFEGCNLHIQKTFEEQKTKTTFELKNETWILSGGRTC